MTKLQKPAPTPLTQRFTASSPRNEGRNLTPPRAQLRPPAAPPAIPQNSQSAEISAGLSTDLIHAAAQPSAVVEHPPAPTYDKRSLAGGAGASTPMRAKALQARLSASAFGSRLQGSRGPARRALEHFAGRQTTTLRGRRKELAGSGRGRQSRIPGDPGQRQGYLGGRNRRSPVSLERWRRGLDPCQPGFRRRSHHRSHRLDQLLLIRPSTDHRQNRLRDAVGIRRRRPALENGEP